MPGVVRIGLAGSPPAALFSRDAEVPDELWSALSRNVDAGAGRQLDDQHLSVPIERVLSSRQWLGQLLTT